MSSDVQKIGLFVARSTKGKLQYIHDDLNIVSYKFFALIIMLLLTHGDIDTNPGPKCRTSNYFSCFHWNVNSIMAHNKLSLLSACNTFHKFDVICISETYLDKSADNVGCFCKRKCDSLHARLNSHYKAWSYKKKNHNKKSE